MGDTNRSVNIPSADQVPQDNILQDLMSASEDDAATIIRERIAECQGYYEELIRRYNENKEYWKGNQIDESKLNVGESKIVINKIFQAVETIVPIATRKTPEPSIVIKPRTNANKSLKDKLERLLKDEWDIYDKMRQQMQIGDRNGQMAGFVCGKMYWCEDEQRSKHYIVNPRSIMFPRGYATKDELPYIVEIKRYTLTEIKDLFPDKFEEVVAKVKTHGDKPSLKSQIIVFEYWENDLVAYLYEDILLKRTQSPLYDFKNVKNNHFAKPKSPYLFTSFISTGENIADDTTTIEQSISIQNAVNKRKRQIETNTEFANGRWVVAGNYISRDEAENIGNNDHAIYLEGADNVEGKLTQLLGRQLDNGTYTDMLDSKSEIDNIFGTHSTTRGERDSIETATGRAILKESDYGRIDLTTTNLEQYDEEYFNWKIQMWKLFKTDDLEIDSEYYDAKSRSDVKIKINDFKKAKILCKVKDGSTAPKEPIAEQAQAIDLAKNKLMSLKDLYEVLDYPNPNKMAKNALLEQTDPAQLYPEITDPMQFELLSVRHTVDILADRQTGDQEVDLFKGELEAYSKHLSTHIQYLKGVEIYDGLPDYESLSEFIKGQLKEHIELEKINLEELANQQEQQMQGQQAQAQDLVTQQGAVEQQGLEAQAMMQDQAMQQAGMQGAMPPEGMPPAQGMAGMLSGGNGEGII